MDFWDSLIRMVSALAVVLGLMGGLVFLSRRFLGTRVVTRGGEPLVRVLGSGYLGPRKSVAVVAVCGELHVLGVTANDLVPIGKVTDPEQVRRLLAGAGTDSKVQV
jgi:flagellar protein FliO/FliZ